MKLTVGDCYNVKPALDDLYATKLPVVTAFRVKKIVNAVNGEISVADPERIKIFEKFKVPFVEGENRYDIEKWSKQHPQKAKEADAEYAEFMKHEVELDIKNFKPIKVKDLGDIVIEPQILDVLEKFIEE